MLEFEKTIVGHLHRFDFSRLHPFGCRAFAHQQVRSSKLNPTSKSLIFVGLERGARAARLWDPETSRILVSGDILCREEVFPGRTPTKQSNPNDAPDHVSIVFPTYPDAPPTPVEPVSDHLDDAHTPSAEPDIPPSPNTCNPAAATPPTTAATAAPDARRSERTRAPVVRYGFSAIDHSSPEHDHPTYNQAMKGPESAAWKQACQEEFDSLLQHNVGTLIDAPPDANILGGMWRLTRKRDEHNRIVRYKARWVAFGNHQVKGLDYEETYASVGSVNSLQILVAMAAGSEWIIWQFDIVTAFLNGKMLEDVYI